MRHSFYGRIYAESYDRGDARHNQLAFYLQQWERAGKPTPVLEPMCGTGFFLIPFLEAGADIDGLDSSPYMLEVCRTKCAAKGLRVTLYEQLLEELALPRRYAFIFIPDRSFAHIYDKEVAQHCLHRLGEQLMPGGWLVLDLKTPPQAGEFGAPGQTDFAVEDRDDGATIFSTSVWGEREGGRVIRNWTKYERYIDRQLVETDVFDYNERFYDQEEFENMLRSAGFVRIHAMQAYTGAPPAAHDVIVYACCKP